MTEEMSINMITNCARMEAALKLLACKMQSDDILNRKELNEVLVVAGMPKIEKDPTTAK